MFNNVALDVVIGLVFVYLLYSLLVTIIQEIIANKLSYRAKFLEKAITRMLEDEVPESKKWWHLALRINPKAKDRSIDNNFSRTFYDHPLIKYLGEKSSKSKPSYLVNATFSKTIIDLLRGDKTVPGQEIRSKIQDTLDSGIIKWVSTGKTNADKKIKPQTLQYINSIWTDAQGDVDRFRELLENWFDETMDRTTGWYKKYTQFISLLIGLSIAIVFNVDTIAIAHKLEKDPKLREQIVQQADNYIKAHPNSDEELKKEKEKKEQSIKEDIKNNKADSVKKDSLITIADKKVDENYKQIQKRGDSLLIQADSLVQSDLKKTNEILGLGISSYKFSECRNCNCLENFGSKLSDLMKSLFGWLITALALSLGAPFWFDLLNKLMKLRTSVAPSSDDDKGKKSDTTVSKIKRVG